MGTFKQTATQRSKQPSVGQDHQVLYNGGVHIPPLTHLMCGDQGSAI